MDLHTITQLYDFSGRTVAITGGAGVLASEIACALVGCNANVVILDRDMHQRDGFPASTTGRGVSVCRCA
jgi:NAD(P)-dependent dehydrogenase (short-subunit alcohol dehydrogenase family)